MSEINTWPGWECVRQLGEGSFGKVYEIQRLENGKIYKAALKVITIPQNQAEIENAYSEGMTKENVTTYFKSFVDDITNEVALMSDLKGYTNIVSYEDHMVVKHEDGIGWDILIRMELLTPLLRWIEKYPMDEKMVIKLGCDICTALELCHKNNIIHRDIKPENIFVNKNGDFKLGDFGIARVAEKTTSVMSQKGTYTYMAPEVYKGQKYNETVDIYSLGIVLYRFLNNNRTPFLPTGQITYNDRKMALDKRLSGEPISAPMNGNDKLKMLVLKAIQYDPSERFPNAKALKNALEHLGDDREDITKDIHGGKKDNNVADDKTQKMQNLRENNFQEEDITIRKKHVVIPQKKKKKGGTLFVVFGVSLAALLIAGAVLILNSELPGTKNKETMQETNVTEIQSDVQKDKKNHEEEKKLEFIEEHEDSVEKQAVESNSYEESKSEQEESLGNMNQTEDIDNAESGYVGYLDEYSQWDFASYFVNKDYDGDGNIDRVYQEKYGISIEFGNGTHLLLSEADNIQKMTNSIIVEKANLTDKEKDEIIVLSDLSAYSTGPQCSGLLKIYGWNGSQYEEMKLPFTDGKVYVKYEQLGDVTLEAFVLGTDYSCEIDVSDQWHSPEEYIDWYGGVTEEHPTWQVYLKESGGQEQLVCRVNLLSHKDAEGLEVALKYQDGKFEIDDIMFFENNYNSGLSDMRQWFGIIERI